MLEPSAVNSLLSQTVSMSVYQAWCEQHNISLKSYYYWIAKIRKLALEDLPRKNNGIHATADQYTLLQNPASEFAEIPLPGRHATRSDPAVVLHIGTITVEVFEDISCELLSTILKAVQSC